MNLEDYDYKKPKKLEKIDELFLRKLNSLISNCTCRFKTYNYSKVKDNLEDFFWHMFCDNYLEIVKKRIYNNKLGKKSAQYTLYSSLLTILKLVAPIMPFISEEIYQTYYKKHEKDKSIHISNWPKSDGSEEKLEEILDLFLEILTRVRQEKSNNKKAMNAEIVLTIEDKDYNKLKEMLEDLKDVTNASEIKKGEFRVEFA